ncbi:hypothetical protein ACET3Z_005424 [Daucus carota]
MRNGMVVLPMLMGCGSPSSLDVLNPTSTKPKPQCASHLSKKQEGKSEESLLAKTDMNNSFSIPSIAGGIHKLIFKSFSHVFVYKGDGEGSDEDEDEEMEIGAPTDVKHVTHIGIGECDIISSVNVSVA